MCAWCSQKTEDVESPGTGVIIDSYELPCECWEPNPCPLSLNCRALSPAPIAEFVKCLSSINNIQDSITVTQQ